MYEWCIYNTIISRTLLLVEPYKSGFASLARLHNKNISRMKQKWRCLISAFYPKWDKNGLKRVSLTLKVHSSLSYKVNLDVRLTNSFGMKLHHNLKIRKRTTHVAQPSMSPREFLFKSQDFVVACALNVLHANMIVMLHVLAYMKSITK